jgi:hypothetical protein
LVDYPFEKSVFINCPFDKDYEPILQAILFCLVYIGLKPRLATENNDSLSARLDKIKVLIESSKYSIHDLSRCQATKEGEYYRLNMPFELGIDYGCRQYFGNGRECKKILVLEETKRSSHVAISDLSGCDFESHEGSFEKAVRKVRNWLYKKPGVDAAGPKRILDAYADFQEWYYERQLAVGFSEEDIQDYPTEELLDAMQDWVAEGKPIER